MTSDPTGSNHSTSATGRSEHNNANLTVDIDVISAARARVMVSARILRGNVSRKRANPNQWYCSTTSTSLR